MLDVFGLGNAIVDTEVNVDDSFLQDHGVEKGLMTLTDDDRMQTLLAALDGHPRVRSSGGSAANSIFAMQAFGLRTAYTCKVADDATGRFFIEDMTRAGVQLNVTATQQNGASGVCLVLITPDAERSMNTNLGVSAELGLADADLDLVSAARYYYVEGYLSSSPSATATAVACREHAELHKTQVAVSLSDPAMVEFCREGLEGILGNGVHTLFCNEEEALSWARTDRLDVAIKELKDIAQELYVTLGAQGSLAVGRDGQQRADGFPTQAVDTTGAGDMYAGACLTARLAGAAPKEAARFANHCASTVVAQYGARLAHVEDYQLLRERFQ